MLLKVNNIHSSSLYEVQIKVKDKIHSYIEPNNMKLFVLRVIDSIKAYYNITHNLEIVR